VGTALSVNEFHEFPAGFHQVDIYLFPLHGEWLRVWTPTWQDAERIVPGPSNVTRDQIVRLRVSRTSQTVVW